MSRDPVQQARRLRLAAVMFALATALMLASALAGGGTSAWVVTAVCATACALNLAAASRTAR